MSVKKVIAEIEKMSRKDRMKVKEAMDNMFISVNNDLLTLYQWYPDISREDLALLYINIKQDKNVFPEATRINPKYGRRRGTRWIFTAEIVKYIKDEKLLDYDLAKVLPLTQFVDKYCNYHVISPTNDPVVHATYNRLEELGVITRKGKQKIFTDLDIYNYGRMYKGAPRFFERNDVIEIICEIVDEEKKKMGVR